METHTELVERYAVGESKLKQAIAGLTTEDLLAVPVEGKWSIQQLVIHVADAELAFADRFKRVIASDNPTLMAWDQDAYITKLFYADQSAEDAAMEVELTRRQMTRVFKKLPAAAFIRTGMHTERGKQTLSDVLTYCINHLEHHLHFLYDKREKLGKLMW